MNIPNLIFENLVSVFWVKIDADKHPGSVTLSLSVVSFKEQIQNLHINKYKELELMGRLF